MVSGEQMIIEETKKLVNSNLSRYPLIKKYLGPIIKRRSAINLPEKGALTSSLLDYNEWSEKDLERLEHALQIGETSHCQDFKRIFKIGRLPEVQEIADGRIIDMLAEVKAFEFLCNHGFNETTYCKQKSNTRVVDFTTKKNGDNYAVEVTRLGLPKSNRKKPRYIVKDSIPSHNIPGLRELAGEWFLISGKENIPRIIETIRGAIENEYPQIEGFCRLQGGIWKGMLIISTGRDYFVLNEYARTEFEITPSAVKEALEQVWNSLKKVREDYKCLHHIVVTMGKDLRKAITYPRL